MNPIPSLWQRSPIGKVGDPVAQKAWDKMTSDLPPIVILHSGNAEETTALWQSNDDMLQQIAAHEEILARSIAGGTLRAIPGFSLAAGRQVKFAIGNIGGQINWREDLACPITGLNNRVRAGLLILATQCAMSPKSKIYITEQLTPLFSHLKRIYPGAIGSEWLGPIEEPGRIRDGIRHEDLTSLTFPDASFDIAISFDCMEHIPNYQRAIGQLYRILRPGGYALMTFPFIGGEQTKIRATVSASGKIIHHHEPEYHGDPIGGGKGILCYYHFGHDILACMRSAGFNEVKVIWIWSWALGHLGGLQVYFLAKRSF